MLTFPVDDVVPAAEPLPVVPLASLRPDALVLGGDPALPVLEPDGVHPLLSAVARAFAEHRPLVLSPDAVWLTIAAGLAQHIRLHAEELRPRLVGHPGRKRIIVEHDGPFPTDPDIWAGLIDKFAREIDGGDLFGCAFSTSSDVDRVAGQVVMLDAYTPYFSLWLDCICGIPRITLTGTVDDWRSIRARVDAFEGYGLDRWRRSLEPILDQFVRASRGDVDTAFWQRVYNPADAYGGDLITGWVARFYPYLRGIATYDEPNPLLDLPITEPSNLTAGGPADYRGPGIRSSSVPATLSTATINVLGGAVALHAGLAFVAQDPDGGLRPVAGWHLIPAEPRIDDVIDRIVDEHRTTPPTGDPMWYASEDLAAIYRRIGSATLFGGAWRLRPCPEHGEMIHGGHHILLIADLPEGRLLGAALDLEARAFRWLVCRAIEPESDDPDDREAPELLDDPAQIPLYGTSLAALLAMALETKGDISSLESGRLGADVPNSFG